MSGGSWGNPRRERSHRPFSTSWSCTRVSGSENWGGKVRRLSSVAVRPCYFAESTYLFEIAGLTLLDDRLRVGGKGFQREALDTHDDSNRKVKPRRVSSGLWQYQLLSQLCIGNAETPTGGGPARSVRPSLPSSKCKSSIYSSRQRRISIRPSCTAGARRTGIGCTFQNGCSRLGASP